MYQCCASSRDRVALPPSALSALWGRAFVSSGGGGWRRFSRPFSSAFLTPFPRSLPIVLLAASQSWTQSRPKKRFSNPAQTWFPGICSSLVSSFFPSFLSSLFPSFFPSSLSSSFPSPFPSPVLWGALRDALQDAVRLTIYLTACLAVSDASCVVVRHAVHDVFRDEVRDVPCLAFRDEVRGVV